MVRFIVADGVFVVEKTVDSKNVPKMGQKPLVTNMNIFGKIQF